MQYSPIKDEIEVAFGESSFESAEIPSSFAPPAHMNEGSREKKCYKNMVAESRRRRQPAYGFGTGSTKRNDPVLVDPHHAAPGDHVMPSTLNYDRTFNKMIKNKVQGSFGRAEGNLEEIGRPLHRRRADFSTPDQLGPGSHFAEEIPSSFAPPRHLKGAHETKSYKNMVAESRRKRDPAYGFGRSSTKRNDPVLVDPHHAAPGDHILPGTIGKKSMNATVNGKRTMQSQWSRSSRISGPRSWKAMGR